MNDYIEHDFGEHKLQLRLTHRRNGVSNRKKIEPARSNTYCNNCHTTDILIECAICKFNLCSECFNGKVVCEKCVKMYPNAEIRNGEHVNNSILKRYICCCLNCNKK